jgi:predicted Zn-dependent protease
MTRFLALVSCLLLASPTVSAAKPKAAKAKGARLTPPQLVKQGDALVMMGSFEEAAKAYEQALKQDPKLVDAKVKLAHCTWRMGKAADAKKMLEELTKEGRPPADALALLGDIYLAEKNYAQAATVLEKLVAERPNDLKAKVLLADCYKVVAESGNAEAKAKAIALYAQIEKAATDRETRRAAMEAGLTLQYGEAGRKIVSAKELIASGKEAQALQQLNSLAKQYPKLAYLHYLRGMAYISSSVDDRKAALAAFKQGAAHADASYQLAVLHYERGELAPALKSLQATLKKEPRHQAALYHLGLVHQEQGNEKKAQEAWTQAMRVDPDSAIARWAQTKLQVMTGHIRALAPGQVIDPASEIQIGRKVCEMIEQRYQVMKDPRLEARLERIFEKLAAQSDRPRRDLRYKIAVINVPIVNAVTVPNGKIYMFSGMVDLIRTRLGDRDDVYAAVLAHELAHSALRHGVGMIKMASSQVAANEGSSASSFDNYWALAKLMGALSRTHEYEADQYGVLYAYRAGFDPTAGIALHRKMLQHKGEIPRGVTHPQHKERIERMTDYLLEVRGKVRQFHLGVKALEQREFDKAVDHLEIFLGVFPDSAPGRNNLAVALHRKALMKTPALAVFRRSTDIDPNVRVKTISLQSSSDDEKRARKIDKRLLKEAVAEYMMVLKKDPRYPQALSNLATALSDLGDLRQARALLERALKVDPNYKEARNNLGIVLAQQNDNVRASAELMRAVQLDAKFAAAHFNLALVFERLGRNPEAAREWDTFMRLDPKSGWHTVAKARRAALKL